MLIPKLFKPILFAWMLFLIVGSPEKSFGVSAGQAAPDFNLQTLDGKEISYSRDIRGNRPLYLIFWATW